MATDPLVTAAEIAAIVKTQPETITLWARKKIIPSVRINRKVVRYRAADVIAALEKHATENAGGVK